MAKVFVSYTSKDRDWAFWIGQELEKLGHAPHIHEWEISAGGNIVDWMEKRLDDADHVLCVVSKVYLDKDYSTWERQSGQWAAISERTNFVLPAFVEDCKPPRLLAPLKRCDLYGLSEAKARAELKDYLKPAVRPAGPMRFPGSEKAEEPPRDAGKTATFPGVRQPRNLPFSSIGGLFIGRDQALADLRAALVSAKPGALAVRVVSGLGGVGKTRLAIEYAWAHAADYSALLFARADDAATLDANLAVVAGASVLDLQEKEARDDATKIAAILRWLETHPTWLMILDNVDDKDAVAAVSQLMPRLKGGHVIVTARATNFPAGFRKLELDVLDEGAARQFLLDRTDADRSKTKDDPALPGTLAASSTASRSGWSRRAPIFRPSASALRAI